MPWKEPSLYEQKVFLVQLVEVEGVSVTAAAARCGISRPTASYWVNQYRRAGLAGLEAQSHAPQHCPHAVAPETLAAVLAYRARYPEKGPDKLVAELRRQQPTVAWPSPSTVGRHLVLAGCITQPKGRRRLPIDPSPGTVAQHPNHVWSIDFKAPVRLGDGTRCDTLTVVDQASRYLLAAIALPAIETQATRAVLTTLFQTWGLPQILRSDNGPPFASRAWGGLSRLGVWCIKLEIHLERGRPGRPTDHARHERMHRTLQAATGGLPAPTLRAHQARCTAFQHHYNTERAHAALGLTPPAEHYGPSPRVYPAQLPIWTYPPSMEVRRIRPNGTLRWHGAELFLSEVLAGERIGLLPLTDRWSAVYFGPLCLCRFDTWRLRFRAPGPPGGPKAH